MSYLNERNKENKARKDAVMPKREEDPSEDGAHSTPTKHSGGELRGKKKARGLRPPRAGEAPNERGHERAPMRNLSKKAIKARPGMAGPKGALPESTKETKMSYLDKVLSINEKKDPAKKVNRDDPDTDRYTTAGRTGQPTPANRLIKAGKTSRRNTGKATALASSMVKQHTAGPKGKLPDHTEYKRIGALMAEALGHRVDEIAPLIAGAAKVGGMAARGLAKAGMAAGKAAGKAAKAGAKATGRAAKKAATDVATDVASNMADRMQKKEMEESYIYPYYMLALHIAEAADEGFVKSPLAKKAAATSGAERVSDLKKPGTKMTSHVKRIARQGNEIVSKKVGAKTNVKTAAALQIGQRAERAKNRKAGIGLPRETPDIARADAALDKKKMAGPEG
jgi:hypothetical protein